MVTHEPDVAKRASRIIRLSDGQIVEDWRIDSSEEREGVRERLRGSGPDLSELRR